MAELATAPLSASASWRVARASAVVGLLLAGSLLVLWLSPFEGAAEFASRRMKFNSTLSFVALSLSLLLYTSPRGTNVRAARGLAALAGVVGALTAVEYAAGLDFGIDELIEQEANWTPGVYHANRMSPAAAVALMLLGGAMFVVKSRSRKVAVGAHLGLLGVLATSFVSLLGHAYDVMQLLQPVATLRRITPMSIAALSTLAVGVLALRPDVGLTKKLAAPGPGGWVARRALPLAIVIPTLFGFVRLQAERAHLFSSATGNALLVLAVTSTLGGTVFGLARALERLDERRRASERLLEQSMALTTALARAATVDEVVEVTTSLGLAALGADAGGFFLVASDGLALEMRRIHGYGADIDAAYRRMPFSVRAPATDAYLSRTPMFIGSLAEYERLYPHIPVEQMRVHAAWAALPLIGKTRPLGVVGLSFTVEQPFDAAVRARLAQLAFHCAQALERALLFDSEHDARGRAEAAVRVRDDFLTAASHELRTPITSLQLHQEMLARGLARAEVPPELVARAAQARRQTERLSILVDRLLDVSRITAGRVVLELAELDLGALVREVVEQFVTGAGDLLHVEAPAGVVGKWDRLRLEQVVTNLVSNAVKYGRGKPIEVTVEKSGDAATVRVRDHGLGIPDEAMPRLFQRFERASRSDYPGIGLGLWLSRELVLAHGGTIGVTSTPGEGSEFTVRLPLVLPAIAAA